jgi:ZIP family zinc transporter
MLGVVLFDLLPEALGKQPEHLGLYLGFFGGILLYLATSDILPEAHASHPTRLTLACTIIGAGFMWLVTGLAS